MLKTGYSQKKARADYATSKLDGPKKALYSDVVDGSPRYARETIMSYR